MDRSLWLLLRLRVVAQLRRWNRGLKTPRGVLLAIVGVVTFLPMTLPFFLMPRVLIAAQVEAIRRFGPLALLAYGLLNLLLSSGDRAISYTPAEVDFLFCGPYRPRQILMSKIVGGVGAAMLTALFLALTVAQHTTSFASAVVGLFFTVEMLSLLTLALGLTLNLIGALAASRVRVLAIAAVILLAAGALVPIGRAVFVLPTRELLQRALDSPGLTVALAPFRPFVMTFTADRVWPDLVGWSALCALIDLTLVALVIALNARFLEAAAAASARVHARLERIRQGHLWNSRARPIVAWPMLPWWGGIGPTLWRQLTAASRSPGHLVTLVLTFSSPLLILSLMRQWTNPAPDSSVILPAFFMLVLFGQATVTYDFRIDRRAIETLKTLPFRPTWLTLGQLAGPVLILSVVECLALMMLAILDVRGRPLIAGSAALIVPVNVLSVAIENLFFLWYPHRLVGVNSLDLPAMGRQLLLMLAKLLALGAIGSVAAAAGGLVYVFGGESLTATVTVAALILTVGGLGLVPLVALAFERFDVAGDAPES